MKPVSPDVNLPQMEQEILAYWDKMSTFYRSNEKRQNAKHFAFYDGPPFANGLPHYGHLLANTIKDTVPRYWNMRGYHVERRFGWDCHGLPVEFEIEKQHNLVGRQDILKMGVAKFNELCRESVLHYAGEWQRVITRLGRWVDWQNQYRTMDLSFMESVWWVFSELYNRGLVYRGHKVVPYSPRITAVLSNFEANQNYKDVQDPAITVKFKLTDEDAYILAWTTTPWTLVSNLALVVGPEIPYVKVKNKENGELYYLAEARLGEVFKTSKKQEETPFEIISKVSAKQLLGRSYEPLFPYFKSQANAFKVIAGDYVTTDDGTGVVHAAPGFGEIDFLVCQANGIDIVDPLDEEGIFTNGVAEFAGLFVKDADKPIIQALKNSGHLLRHDTIVHSYPFCERTDSPLIYRAIPAWYVAVEKVKSELVANNQKINWVPDHLKDGRMGKWLENARDWAISRNRFWGTPLPIWICEKNDEHRRCVGSAAELEKLSGRKVTDLHKHFIDDITFSCGECSGKMSRIAEVFDCWFESGSMPYAQNHYPFEHEEKFKQTFPADFIAEGLDQTRGWFYTLSVLSTALFNKPAFKNVVVNGLVLAEDGRKMSKRWRNYTPPEELIAQFGADSVRLYMLNSAILRGEDLKFSNQGVKDTTRAAILPLWNAFSFLSTYAEADNWQPRKELVHTPPRVSAELDRWIISRFQTLVAKIQTQMEAYRLYNVVPEILTFTEDLTNWYIRLSRRRFWGGSTKLPQDTVEAYETLFHILVNFSKVFAPFAPFVAERIYQGLTQGLGVEDSVHLNDMPNAREEFSDRDLEASMDLVRRVTELGRSLRAKHQIKTRQVLSCMTVISAHTADRTPIERARALIENELNVKDIKFSDDELAYVNLTAKPNLPVLGKKLGSRLKEFRAVCDELNHDQKSLVSLLQKLEAGEKPQLKGFEISKDDLFIERQPKDNQVIATDRGVTVLLDTNLTAELVLEGLAREVVNRIQKLRKDSGLEVTDRIKVQLNLDGQASEAVKRHRDYISGEVLATELLVAEAGKAPGGKFSQVFEINGADCQIAITPVT